MEKLEFQKIIDTLAKRIELCELHLGNIHTTDDLSKLTIAYAVNLKNFCVTEEEIMTKIAMVDLYHIIGMGDLTPPQMMKFTYTMQKYLQHRPIIKAIAKYLDSIFELPKIPVATQYRLMGLGDGLLTSGAGEAVVEEASVEDYQRKSKNELLPFRLEGNQIKVDMAQFDFFVTLMANITKSPLSTENFKSKLTAHGEYMGIQWIDCNAYEAIGLFKSADMYTRISGYYNKRI